jgi:hypothetical protein
MTRYSSLGIHGAYIPYQDTLRSQIPKAVVIQWSCGNTKCRYEAVRAGLSRTIHYALETELTLIR